MLLPTMVKAELNVLYFSHHSNILDQDNANYLAKLSTYADNLRKDSLGNTLLIHGGNAFFPSEISKYDQGHHMIILANMMQVDAMAISNRDLIYGSYSLTKNARTANFPLIASDLIHTNNKKPIKSISQLVETQKGGKRIAISAPLLGSKYIPSFVEKTPLETLSVKSANFQNQIDVIKQADLSILVAPRLDTAPSSMTNLFNIGITRPEYVTQHQFGSKTKIASVANNNKHVLLIKIDDNNNVSSQSVDISNITPDKKVLSFISRYNKHLDEVLQVAIAKASVELTSEMISVRAKQNTLASTFADAIRDHTKADIAVINGGAIRGDRIYPKDYVFTRLDINNELAFDHNIDKIKTNGLAIYQMMENSLSKVENLDGRFLQVSGMKVTYDISKPSGQRIKSITFNGVKLTPEQPIHLALSDFMLGGGDEYTMFKGSTELTINSSKKLSDIVAEYLMKTKVIGLQTGTRLIAQ